MVGVSRLGRPEMRRRRRLSACRKDVSKLALVAQRTMNLVVITDARGNTEWVNEPFERLTGFSLEEVRGKAPGPMLQGPETDPATVSFMGECLRQGRGFDVDIVNYTKDRRPYWIRVEVQPVLDKRGRLTNFIAIETDISERKRQEEQLAEALVFARSSLDALSAHVAILDDRGVILATNSAWQRFAERNGAGAAIGIGANYLAVCDHCSNGAEADAEGEEGCDGDAGKVADGIREVIAHDRDIFELEYPCHSPTKQRWFVVRATRFPEGGPDCVVVAHENVTQRKLAELNIERFAMDLREANVALEDQAVELRRARQEAEQANQAKSQFLANMSHEIRTPMTAILGYADLLMERPAEGPQQREFVQTIRRNGKHLLAILDDILDLSKIEAGKMTVERVEVELPELLADVASLFRLRSKEKELEFRCEVEGPMPPTIRTDPTRLRQVLFNLLGNAVKFTERGSVTLGVRCLPAGPNRTADAVVFRVSDTGIGMSEAQLGRLFKPFSQADTSTSRRFGGTGLGLVLSQRLAEMLGGGIRAESKAGAGSTFVATIAPGELDPASLVDEGAFSGLIDAADARQLRAPVEEARRRQLSAEDAETASRPRRVLLVEDGPDNQRLIAFHLRRAGFEVEIAENGRVGMDKALAASVAGAAHDAVVMDMQMPEMDGYAATAALRKASYRRPIVALTAHAMSGDRERCLSSGCDDYLSKPIDPTRLVATLDAHIAAAGERAEDGAGETEAAGCGGDGAGVDLEAGHGVRDERAAEEGRSFGGMGRAGIGPAYGTDADDARAA